MLSSTSPRQVSGSSAQQQHSTHHHHHYHHHHHHYHHYHHHHHYHHCYFYYHRKPSSPFTTTTLTTPPHTHTPDGAIATEGIFRRSVALVHLKEIQKLYNERKKVDLTAENDVQLAAVLMKSFFRELAVRFFPFLAFIYEPCDILFHSPSENSPSTAVLLPKYVFCYRTKAIYAEVAQVN
jgi:hypothetical protein